MFDGTSPSVVSLEHNQYPPCSLYTTILHYPPRSVTWQGTTSLGLDISLFHDQRTHTKFRNSNIQSVTQKSNSRINTQLLQISIQMLKSTASLSLLQTYINKSRNLMPGKTAFFSDSARKNPFFAALIQIYSSTFRNYNTNRLERNY